eukprot:15344782-Ditylum_brightwellii.AAC.1
MLDFLSAISRLGHCQSTEYTFNLYLCQKGACNIFAKVEKKSCTPSILAEETRKTIDSGNISFEDLKDMLPRNKRNELDFIDRKKLDKDMQADKKRNFVANNVRKI